MGFHGLRQRGVCPRSQRRMVSIRGCAREVLTRARSSFREELCCALNTFVFVIKWRDQLSECDFEDTIFLILILQLSLWLNFFWKYSKASSRLNEDLSEPDRCRVFRASSVKCYRLRVHIFWIMWMPFWVPCRLVATVNRPWDFDKSRQTNKLSQTLTM